MIRARGDFDRANARGLARVRGTTPAATLAAFAEAIPLRRTPPANLATRLVEAIVHGEDIRRPLGLTGHYPTAAITHAIDYQVRTAVGMGGGKERAAGRRLIATDIAETDSAQADTAQMWGDGPETIAPALALLLEISGREIAPNNRT